MDNIYIYWSILYTDVAYYYSTVHKRIKNIIYTIISKKCYLNNNTQNSESYKSYFKNLNRDNII